MTTLFILFVWLENEPSPAGVYLDNDKCWQEAVALSEIVEAADCRVFTSPSEVGERISYAPESSPRPMPRPEVTQ